MIIVKLMGGLGNQMFQYAAARRLAWRHGTELKLDLSHLEGSQEGCTPRRFELGNLKVTAALASPQETAWISRPPQGRLERIGSRLGWGLGLKCLSPYQVKELHFHFDPRVLHAPDDTYLEGYWQSERYFADIARLLREEFTLRAPLSGRHREIGGIIAATHSVSLHVRRGDYVTNEQASRIHGFCGVDYYRRCLRELVESVPDPHLFVFSDDPEWVRVNLKLPFPTTFVTDDGAGEPCEELRLMSLCRHNIIANSSFSWWGGWLNQNPGKLVFAPKNWFRDPSYDTCDLVPAAWLRR